MFIVFDPELSGIRGILPDSELQHILADLANESNFTSKDFDKYEDGRYSCGIFYHPTRF